MKQRSQMLLVLAGALVACGKSDGENPRRGNADADSVLQVAVGDEIILNGKFEAGSEQIAEGYGRSLESRYTLVVENKAALMVAAEQRTSFCETGAEVIGPYFTLLGDNDFLRTTDEHRHSSSTDLEDFPGVLEPGAYELTLAGYSQGECQYHYSAVIQTRSDVSVLEPGEWDPALTGGWLYTGWEGGSTALEFAPNSVLYKRFDGQGRLITHIKYEAQIDGSVIPGNMLLTVTRVHRLADTEEKQKIGDELLCIYRVFPGYEGSPSLWWTCGRDGEYPETFDYPLKDYLQQEAEK